MVFVGLTAAFAPLTAVGQMTSIGTLLAFVVVCLGVLVLRYKEPNLLRPFKTPWVPFVPLAGIIVCLLMMFSLGLATWLRLIIWLAIGMFIYFFYSRYQITS
jgi:APA family basic amino acid/polyamine antiporter